MKPTKQEALSQVFILHTSDEMHHPYEAVLSGLCGKVRWFSTLAEMVDAKSGTEAPFAVITDLDCLEQPLDVQLELVRSTFASSDLIALSGSDSAQLALQCVRSGYSDFLLKPASPEELAWSIRKARQRFDFLQKLDDPKANMVRAVTQISSCTTPTLARLCTLEYLRTFLQSEGAAWIKWEKAKGSVPKPRVLGAVPRGTEVGKVRRNLPQGRKWMARPGATTFKSKTSNKRKIFLPCHGLTDEGLLLWGIPERIPGKTRVEAEALLEHCKLSLLNIQRFEQIRQQTFMDDLTGLYNSRYLKFALNNAILKCKDPGQAFSLLFIDVDYFKTINDRYGHMVGSEFLVAIGKTIKNAVRNIDPVFRYGGDEFVVILQGAHQDGAAEIGERIRKNIERRVFIIKNHRIQTTVSIGIAVYPDHANEREALLRLADEAMYSAKKNTRNAVHLAFGLDNPAKARRTG